MESEKEIESLLVRLVKQSGGAALKFVCPGHAGVPDRIVIFPGGHIWFVELKTETGRLTRIQKYWQNRLKELGCRHQVLRSRACVAEFVHSVTIGEGG